MSRVAESAIKGATEALEYIKGKKDSGSEHQVIIQSDIDVSAIRDQLNMSRTEFARHFGFSLRTLEKWEQGVRHPNGAARAYLTVISRDPEAVERALSK